MANSDPMALEAQRRERDTMLLFRGIHQSQAFTAEAAHKAFAHVRHPSSIPEGSMRVAPGSDAVVWLVNPEHSGEL